MHRDIKPENVLISESGLAKITDFGLAKLAQSTDLSFGESLPIPNPLLRMRFASGAVGTPPYMAPEQWVPTTELDSRADVYAVGCLLYEMLAGQLPFEANTLEEFNRRHLDSPIPILHAQSVPAGLNAIVTKCLAKRREERFGSPGDLLQELTLLYQQLFSEQPRRIVLSNEYSATEYSNRGAAYSHMGLYERALRDYNQAVALAPHYALAHTNRGNAFLHLKRFDEALSSHDTAIKLEPLMSLANHNRGVTHSRTKMLEKAIVDFDRAIELEPGAAA